MPLCLAAPILRQQWEVPSPTVVVSSRTLQCMIRCKCWRRKSFDCPICKQYSNAQRRGVAEAKPTRCAGANCITTCAADTQKISSSPCFSSVTRTPCVSCRCADAHKTFGGNKPQKRTESNRTKHEIPISPSTLVVSTLLHAPRQDSMPRNEPCAVCDFIIHRSIK